MLLVTFIVDKTLSYEVSATRHTIRSLLD